MNKLKKVLCATFMLCVFLTSGVTALTIQGVTPDNAADSADEITQLYGGMINITGNQIKNFLEQHWTTPSQYDDQCPYPEVTVTDINLTSVAFEWDFLPSPSINTFKVSYLNLIDGNSSSTITGSNSISGNIPDDLYLFTFQSKSEDDLWGSLFIIIIEKPIAFERGACKCPVKKLIWHDQFSTDDSLTEEDETLVYEDWSEIPDATGYFAEVKILGGPTASMIFEAVFQNELPYLISTDPACRENIILNTSNTALFMHEPENTDLRLGVFGFSNNLGIDESPKFSFNFSESIEHNYDSGKVLLYSCQNKPPRRAAEVEDNFKEIGFSSLPNPLKQSTNLQYILPEDDKVSISLYDSFGKLIRNIKDKEYTKAGRHSINLNLDFIESGMYYCILKTQEKTIPLKLVKVN